MDVDDDARTIGARLRQIRSSRKKGLRVIAGLAGMIKSWLSQIERGESVLDRLSDIVALANALQISPSELTTLPMPAPGNGYADSAEDAVRLTLMAVNHNQPGGQVVPVDVLRARVRALLDARYRCDRQDEAGAALPELIRDVHTSIAAGAFDLAQAVLDSVKVLTSSPQATQLTGMLALSESLVAAAGKRPADMAAALEHAAELAQHAGEGNDLLDGVRAGQRGPVADGRGVAGW